MKLTLTTNKGAMVDQWDIEKDFGDLVMDFVRLELAESITASWLRQNRKDGILVLSEKKEA